MKLKGLVLCGGESKRMGKDKKLLHYGKKNQLQTCVELLTQLGLKAYVSIRSEVTLPYSLILDHVDYTGPMAGLAAAYEYSPESDWLIIGCDYPFLRLETLLRLTEKYFECHESVAYQSKDHFIEPFVAIWKSNLLAKLSPAGPPSPSWFLKNNSIEVISCQDNSLTNVNDFFEYQRIKEYFIHQ